MGIETPRIEVDSILNDISYSNKLVLQEIRVNLTLKSCLCTEKTHAVLQAHLIGIFFVRLK